MLLSSSVFRVAAASQHQSYVRSLHSVVQRAFQAQHYAPAVCSPEPLSHSHHHNSITRHSTVQQQLYRAVATTTRRQFHSRNYEKPKEKPFYKRISREMKFAVGVASAVAGYLIYNDYRSEQKRLSLAIVGTGDSPVLETRPPDQKIARSIHNPKDASGLKLTLYQYQTCPFCCKLRVFLDYYGFSYDVVEVNSVTRAQTKWTEYKKVPFLVVEIPGTDYGESTILQLKDSSLIISVLSSALRNPGESLMNLLDSYPSRYNEENKLEFSNRFNVMYGDNPDALIHLYDIQEERVWRKWVDDVFVHVLSPNVYRTPTEALQAFTWFSEVGEWEKLFPVWERLLVIYFGASVMWIIGKKLKRKYRLESDPRRSLYKEAKKWTNLIASARGTFAGGERPNLADLSMYGVLMAIEGCDAFQDVMEENKKLLSWFTEMKIRVLRRDGEQILVKRCTIR